MLQIDLWLTPQEIREIETNLKRFKPEDIQKVVWETAYAVSQFHGNLQLSTGAFVRWTARLAESLLGTDFVRSLEQGVVSHDDVLKDLQTFETDLEEPLEELKAAYAVLNMTVYQIYKIAQSIEQAGIDVLQENCLDIVSGENSGSSIAQAMTKVFDKEVLRISKSVQETNSPQDSWAGFPVTDPS